jgi:hypothetical protein
MNNLSDELPQQIGDLKHLEILSLFNNEIEGQIQTLFMKLRC